MSASTCGMPKTERINPLTKDIDTWPTLRIVSAMNLEDHKVAPAVRREIHKIAAAADLAAECLRGGGKVCYVGSGTSGRLGVLDRSEIRPTFGGMSEQFIAIIAGGPDAIVDAVEGAEDAGEDGALAIVRAGLGPQDLVVGIASSGRTPFVASALEQAQKLSARTVALVGDPNGAVAGAAEIVICPDVGPEVIAGSTRLKAGTAQKLVLNMISTAAMILLGRTWGNLMAGMQVANAKLSARAKEILASVTGKSDSEISRAIAEADGDVALSLVTLLSGKSADEASGYLQENRGNITCAVRATPPAAPAPPTRVPGLPVIPIVPASDAGLDEAQVERAFAVVQEAVGDGKGQIPGAVAAIVHDGKVLGPRPFGWAALRPCQIPMTADTVFDLASLTKVVATTPCILIACERGLLRLDDSVSTFIPEFGDTAAKRSCTMRHLLTHTSGLEAHVKFWETSRSPEEIAQAVAKAPLRPDTMPGDQVVYSDLGFILLGEVLRRATGTTLDRFAQKEVFEPLGMSNAGFAPPKEAAACIAATEYRADLGRVMWGEVHDENAFALGGVAGHAGLFATAEDLARYALMWLGYGTWAGASVLSKSSVKAAISLQACEKKERPSRLNGPVSGPFGQPSDEPFGVPPSGLLASGRDRRGLGWMLKSTAFSSAGDLFSPSSFGHTGFTGTSLWCDPETGTAAILLTNRVHAGRTGNEIIRLRPRFANAVAAAVDRRRVRQCKGGVS